MGIIYFLLFIAACFGILMWVSHKSARERDLARRMPSARKPKASKLHTPADNVLSHREEIWHTRRHNAAASVAKTNRYVPRSVSSQEPEYDGYSRRDRHHLTPESAHVKDESQADDLSISRGFTKEDHPVH
jgi:hypothetical protein